MVLEEKNRQSKNTKDTKAEMKALKTEEEELSRYIEKTYGQGGTRYLYSLYLRAHADENPDLKHFNRTPQGRAYHEAAGYEFYKKEEVMQFFQKLGIPDVVNLLDQEDWIGEQEEEPAIKLRKRPTPST